MITLQLIRKRAPVEGIGMINIILREMIERVQVEIDIIAGGMIILKLKRESILDVEMNNYPREI